jgi:hypothetical protein
VPGTAAWAPIYEEGSKNAKRLETSTVLDASNVSGNAPAGAPRLTGTIAPTGITIHLVRLHKLHLRLLALVVALVQLTGPAAASLADAQLEAAGNRPNAASHIEAHGRPECARVHTDDCALCQYLATAFTHPAPPAADAPLSLAVIRPPVAGLLGYAPAALGALQYSRGPPDLV